MQDGILEKKFPPFFLLSWYLLAPSTPLSLGCNSTSNEWPIRAACLLLLAKIKLALRLQCRAGNCKPSKAANPNTELPQGTAHHFIPSFWTWFQLGGFTLPKISDITKQHVFHLGSKQTCSAHLWKPSLLWNRIINKNAASCSVRDMWSLLESDTRRQNAVCPGTRRLTEMQT